MPTLEEKVNEMYEEFMVPRNKARKILNEFDEAMLKHNGEIKYIVVHAKKRRDLCEALMNLNYHANYIDFENRKCLSYQLIPIIKDNQIKEDEIRIT